MGDAFPRYSGAYGQPIQRTQSGRDVTMQPIVGSSNVSAAPKDQSRVVNRPYPPAPAQDNSAANRLAFDSTPLAERK